MSNNLESPTLRIVKQRGGPAYQQFVGRVFGTQVAAAIGAALREEGKTWDDYAREG